jgi:acetyl esterase
MAVKPEVRTILDLIEGSGAPPLSEQTPEELRAAYAAMSAFGVKDEVASVTDRNIPGPGGDLPVRIYVPAGASAPAGGAGLPVLVWLHGGGWVIGDIETADGTSRAIANGAGAVVVSVDYRLAPEHPFPAAVDDALAAVRWVADNAAELGVDPARLAVGGDSAGGNLAAVVSQQLRDSGPAIAFQLLVYPVIDLSSERHRHESQRTNGSGYFLTHTQMEWFREQYLRDDADGDDPLASPIVAPDLAGLPPAFVVTAEYDPLRDEGEAYAARLRDAAVPTTLLRVPGVFHGFFSMIGLVPGSADAVDAAGTALRAALHPPEIG